MAVPLFQQVGKAKFVFVSENTEGRGDSASLLVADVLVRVRSATIYKTLWRLQNEARDS